MLYEILKSQLSTQLTIELTGVLTFENVCQYKLDQLEKQREIIAQVEFSKVISELTFSSVFI